MHSRIFQVSEQLIDKSDYIKESFFYDHWFLNEVADYVNAKTDRQSDIEWLKGCHKQGITFGADENGEFFIIVDKNKFFEQKFNAFKDALQKLSAMTIDEFVADTNNIDMYNMRQAYNETYGFYTCNNGYCDDLHTMDEFIRFAETDTKYYIGATIDYHF